MWHRQKGLIVQWMLVLLYGQFFASPSFATTLIDIKAGSFKMPAFLDKEPRKVSAFKMDAHAVTNEQFLDFVKKNPQWQKSKAKKIFVDQEYLEYWPSDLVYGDSNMSQSPVVRVSWFAARAYCENLGKRLPSVNEWEYVGLQPLKSRNDLKKVILEWYGEGAVWPLPPVMSKEKNTFGVSDLHGLIWEWVEDFNSSLVTGESRGDSALDKNMFCGAGGAKAADPGDYAAFMRIAFRSSLQARYTVKNLGFRCVKD